MLRESTILVALVGDTASLPWTSQLAIGVGIFLFGCIVGIALVLVTGVRRRRSHRAGLIECLHRVLQCAERLNAGVDSQNDKLNNLGQALDRLPADEELSDAGRQLAAEIQSVLESNRLLELELSNTQSELRRRAAEIDKSRSEARRDPLSGIANRRAFDELTQQALAQRGEFSQPLGLVLVDIDFFKRVNDTFGHRAGDQVLEKMGSTLQAIVGDDGIAARLGGDEYGLLLVRGNHADFVQMAEKIRSAVERSSYSIEKATQPIELTVSVGVAAARPDETAQSWFDRADQALYHAKKAGRNRVCEDKLEKQASV